MVSERHLKPTVNVYFTLFFFIVNRIKANMKIISKKCPNKDKKTSNENINTTQLVL